MALVRDLLSNAEAFLAARPAVRVVDLLLPDLCGVLRGKRIDRSDLAGIYQRGMFLPGIDVCARRPRRHDPGHRPRV